jgi:hypothetical protein
VDITYRPTPTAKKFHKDSSFVRTIIGPIGSGKSVCCIVETLIKAYAQTPDKDGVRGSRWCIIRNTYRELLDTTIISFHEWIPEYVGNFSVQNMKFTIHEKLPDGTTLHVEWLFRALDRPNDVKKLLSLEVTGGFINECKEIPRSVVDMLQGRCGRYPKTIRDPVTKDILYGPTWFGIIMDTNPPDSDSWYYRLFEEDLPENHSIYHQPSGLSAEAENVDNLPEGYYTNMQAGKDAEWVNVYVHGMYGFIADGKPVWPEYKDNIHHTDDVFYPKVESTIYVGIDFGLTPAAVFGQLTPSGRMVLFDELVTWDMGAMNFGRLLHEKITSKYPKHSFEIYADPAGEGRAQTDEVTPFQILSNQGVEAYPTYTNDFTIRREAVADYMQRLDFAGNPAFCITPGAPTLRKACAGGYKYKRMAVAGSERFQDKPDKGKYSHTGDACQYLFLGAVGGERVVGGYGDQPIDYTQTNRMIV